MQLMERYCTNPPPQYGGADCPGKGAMAEMCIGTDCTNSKYTKATLTIVFIGCLSCLSSMANTNQAPARQFGQPPIKKSYQSSL